MPYDLTKPLVIGISSRALFNLETENKIFEEQGLENTKSIKFNMKMKYCKKGLLFN